MSKDPTLSDAAERLRGDAGLVRRAPWSWVLVHGQDREAYLHRMTSQVVEGLAPGRAAYACVLTPKGKVLGDPLIWNLGDALALDQDARASEQALPALERYVITDDVTFEDRSDVVARFALVGPSAPQRLASAGSAVPADGAFVTTPVGGEDVHVLRRDLGALPAFELVVPGAAADALGVSLETREVSPEAYAVVRVEGHMPAYGHELGPETMPLEARLEHVAVAFGKGCYPGQEPVVMAHHRGKPANLLVRLDVDADAAPPVPSVLLREGRAVGRITTIVPAEATQGPRALGLVRHALALAGEALDLEGGGRAQVVAWPERTEGAS